LRYLYGLPVTENKSKDAIAPWQWADLCYAAKGSEIPKLQTYALDKLEESLKEKLEFKDEHRSEEDLEGEEDFDVGVRLFLEALDALFRRESGSHDKIKKVAVKLCCQNFAKIRDEDGEHTLHELNKRVDLGLEILDYLIEHGKEELG